MVCVYGQHPCHKPLHILLPLFIGLVFTVDKGLCASNAGAKILYWTSQNTFKFTMSATWQQKSVEHAWRVNPADSFTPMDKADITDWSLQEGSFEEVELTSTTVEPPQGPSGAITVYSKNPPSSYGVNDNTVFKMTKFLYGMFLVEDTLMEHHVVCFRCAMYSDVTFRPPFDAEYMVQGPAKYTYKVEVTMEAGVEIQEPVVVRLSGYHGDKGPPFVVFSSMDPNPNQDMVYAESIGSNYQIDSFDYISIGTLPGESNLKPARTSKIYKVKVTRLPDNVVVGENFCADAAMECNMITGGFQSYYTQSLTSDYTVKMSVLDGIQEGRMHVTLRYKTQIVWTYSEGQNGVDVNIDQPLMYSSKGSQLDAIDDITGLVVDIHMRQPYPGDRFRIGWLTIENQNKWSCVFFGSIDVTGWKKQDYGWRRYLVASQCTDLTIDTFSYELKVVFLLDKTGDKSYPVVAKLQDTYGSAYFMFQGYSYDSEISATALSNTDPSSINFDFMDMTFLPIDDESFRKEKTLTIGSIVLSYGTDSDSLGFLCTGRRLCQIRNTVDMTRLYYPGDCAGGVEDVEYAPYEGHCYMTHTGDSWRGNFAAAGTKCQDQQAITLRIHNEKAASFITRKLQQLSLSEIWVSFTKASTSTNCPENDWECYRSGWEWDDGSTLDTRIFQWLSDQPPQDAGCGTLKLDGETFGWGAADCTADTKSFNCIKVIDPPPCPLVQCRNGQQCIRPGECECEDGYSGSLCETGNAPCTIATNEALCYWYETRKQTWEQAWLTCHTKGGELALVDSQAVFDKILGKAFSGANTFAWIGASSLHTPGVLRWVNGKTLGWAPRRTRTSEYGRCLTMNHYGFQDSDCNDKFNFICQTVPNDFYCSFVPSSGTLDTEVHHDPNADYTCAYWNDDGLASQLTLQNKACSISYDLETTMSENQNCDRLCLRASHLECRTLQVTGKQCQISSTAKDDLPTTNCPTNKAGTNMYFRLPVVNPFDRMTLYQVVQITSKAKSWDDACKTCYNNGMQLLTIRNAQKDSTLTGLIETDVWLGLSEKQNPGVFSWLEVDYYNDEKPYNRMIPLLYHRWAEVSLTDRGVDGSYKTDVAYRAASDGNWRQRDPQDKLPFFCEFYQESPCLTASCKFPASCTDKSDSFSCRCEPNYSGPLCKTWRLYWQVTVTLELQFVKAYANLENEAAKAIVSAFENQMDNSLNNGDLVSNDYIGSSKVVAIVRNNAKTNVHIRSTYFIEQGVLTNTDRPTLQAKIRELLIKSLSGPSASNRYFDPQGLYKVKVSNTDGPSIAVSLPTDNAADLTWPVLYVTRRSITFNGWDHAYWNKNSEEFRQMDKKVEEEVKLANKNLNFEYITVERANVLDQGTQTQIDLELASTTTIPPPELDAIMKILKRTMSSGATMVSDPGITSGNTTYMAAFIRLKKPFIEEFAVIAASQQGKSVAQKVVAELTPLLNKSMDAFDFVEVIKLRDEQGLTAVDLQTSYVVKPSNILDDQSAALKYALQAAIMDGEVGGYQIDSWQTPSMILSEPPVEYVETVVPIAFDDLSSRFTEYVGDIETPIRAAIIDELSDLSLDTVFRWRDGALTVDLVVKTSKAISSFNRQTDVMAFVNSAISDGRFGTFGVQAITNTNVKTRGYAVRKLSFRLKKQFDLLYGNLASKEAKEIVLLLERQINKLLAEAKDDFERATVTAIQEGAWLTTKVKLDVVCSSALSAYDANAQQTRMTEVLDLAIVRNRIGGYTVDLSTLALGEPTLASYITIAVYLHSQFIDAYNDPMSDESETLKHRICKLIQPVVEGLDGDVLSTSVTLVKNVYDLVYADTKIVYSGNTASLNGDAIAHNVKDTLDEAYEDGRLEHRPRRVMLRQITDGFVVTRASFRVDQNFTDALRDPLSKERRLLANTVQNKLSELLVGQLDKFQTVHVNSIIKNWGFTLVEFSIMTIVYDDGIPPKMQEDVYATLRKVLGYGDLGSFPIFSSGGDALEEKTKAAPTINDQVITRIAVTVNKDYDPVYADIDSPDSKHLIFSITSKLNDALLTKIAGFMNAQAVLIRNNENVTIVDVLLKSVAEDSFDPDSFQGNIWDVWDNITGKNGKLGKYYVSKELTIFKPKKGALAKQYAFTPVSVKFDKAYTTVYTVSKSYLSQEMAVLVQLDFTRILSAWEPFEYVDVKLLREQDGLTVADLHVVSLSSLAEFEEKMLATMVKDEILKVKEDKKLQIPVLDFGVTPASLGYPPVIQNHIFTPVIAESSLKYRKEFDNFKSSAARSLRTAVEKKINAMYDKTLKESVGFQMIKVTDIKKNEDYATALTVLYYTVMTLSSKEEFKEARVKNNIKAAFAAAEIKLGEGAAESFTLSRITVQEPVFAIPPMRLAADPVAFKVPRRSLPGSPQGPQAMVIFIAACGCVIVTIFSVMLVGAAYYKKNMSRGNSAVAPSYHAAETSEQKADEADQGEVSKEVDEEVVLKDRHSKNPFLDDDEEADEYEIRKDDIVP